MNKYFAALAAIFSVYDELATGGAKTEADKLLSVLVGLATVLPALTTDTTPTAGA